MIVSKRSHNGTMLLRYVHTFAVILVIEVPKRPLFPNAPIVVDGAFPRRLCDVQRPMRQDPERPAPFRCGTGWSVAVL